MKMVWSISSIFNEIYFESIIDMLGNNYSCYSFAFWQSKLVGWNILVSASNLEPLLNKWRIAYLSFFFMLWNIWLVISVVLQHPYLSLSGCYLKSCFLAACWISTWIFDKVSYSVLDELWRLTYMIILKNYTINFKYI